MDRQRCHARAKPEHEKNILIPWNDFHEIYSTRTIKETLLELTSLHDDGNISERWNIILEDVAWIVRKNGKCR